MSFMDIDTPSKLQKIIKAGHFGVTSEVGPPRSADGAVIEKKGHLIKDYVDAINVTDNQTSVCRLCSLASCIRLKLMGLEPVLQMVTRDRNRIALQSDIPGFGVKEGQAGNSRRAFFEKLHLIVVSNPFHVCHDTNKFVNCCCTLYVLELFTLQYIKEHPWHSFNSPAIIATRAQIRASSSSSTATGAATATRPSSRLPLWEQ